MGFSLIFHHQLGISIFLCYYAPECRKEKSDQKATVEEENLTKQKLSGWVTLPPTKHPIHVHSSHQCNSAFSTIEQYFLDNNCVLFYWWR